MNERQLQLFLTFKEHANEAEHARSRVWLRGLQMRAGDIDVRAIQQVRKALGKRFQFVGKKGELREANELLTGRFERKWYFAEDLLAEPIIEAIRIMDDIAMTYRIPGGEGQKDLERAGDLPLAGIEPFYEPNDVTKEASRYMRSVIHLALTTGRLVRDPDFAASLRQAGVDPFAEPENGIAARTPREMATELLQAHMFNFEQWNYLHAWSLSAANQLMDVVGLEGIRQPAFNDNLRLETDQETAPINEVRDVGLR